MAIVYGQDDFIFFLFLLFFVEKVQAPEWHSDGAKDFGINMQGEWGISLVA